MTKEILACLEGSASGRRAAELAVDLGRRLDATVTGLAIVDEPGIRKGAAAGIGAYSYKAARDEALIHDAHEHAAHWLAQFEDRCRRSSVRSRTLELAGHPAKTIVATMRDYDLVFIGRHANFRFETAPEDHGTRDSILHCCEKPVIIVPEDQGSAELPHVLIAFDGSPAAIRAVRSFLTSGWLGSASLHVVSIAEMGRTGWDTAESGVDLLHEAGREAATIHSVVSHPSAAATVLELRAKLDASLIVTSAFPHGPLTEFVEGSVTRALVESTPVPLYLHH